MGNLRSLSTTVSADSEAFVRGIDKTRGSLRSLIAQLDPTAAATARYNDKVNLLDRALKQGKITQDEYGVYTDRLRSKLEITGRTSGQLRMGFMVLGEQMRQVSTEFALGINPMQIFAQQSGQIIYSLQMMGQGAKGVLSFLGGPWGIAIGTAAGALLPLIGRLYDTADAAKTAKTELQKALQTLHDEIVKFSTADKAIAEGINQATAATIRLRDLQAAVGRLQNSPDIYAGKGVGSDVRARISQMQDEIKTQKEIIKNAEDAVAKAMAMQRVQNDEATSADKATGALNRHVTALSNAASKALAAADAEAKYQALLGTMGLSDAQRERHANAIAALAGPIGDPVDPQTARLNNSVNNALARFRDQMKSTADASKTATVQIADSFKSMADRTLQSLNSLANAIQGGGGFLGILTAVLNVGLQLGSIGLFGKSVADRINHPASTIPGRASGGPVTAGQAYIVGEKQPELFVPRTSGTIMPNISAGGGAVTINVVPSEYFDVAVDGRIQRAAGPIMQGAANVAVQKQARMASRTIGR